MKKTIVVLAIIILCCLVLGLMKDQIIKGIVTVAASQVTGAPVHVDGFSLGLLNQSIKISGFKIYNPAGFPEGILLDLSKISVKYDLGALLGRKLHLAYAEIELKEMGLEKNKEGQLNVDALKVAKQGKGQEAKPQKNMPFQIDMLKLGVGRIVLKDYSAGGEPVIKVYDINIHKGYKNITSAQQLAALILSEPMKEAGIQGAKIYGVAMIAGAGILPVAIATQFAGKDSAKQEFSASLDNAYEASLAVLKKMGAVSKEDKSAGTISAQVSSAQVYLRIRKKSDGKAEITVSARKYLFPKPEIAAGVLYEISEKLK